MQIERSDIIFPLWRKKVDDSLIKYAETPIPKWLWPIWNIQPLFSSCLSSKNEQGKVRILFKKIYYEGYIYRMRNREFYKFNFEKRLKDRLKDTFIMSYMRSIEQDLRKDKDEYKNMNIEEEIPFWEFLDIEFDYSNKLFHFNSHYIQKPTYIELFKELVKSHSIKIIDDIINSKDEFRFTKHHWLPRKDLKTQLNAINIIYNLINTDTKEIYIGEAENLKQRLNHNRHEFKNWDYYRFDCLPNDLTKKQRVAIERLIIRIFTSFFTNRRGIDTMNVSDYVLANKKIDV